MARIYSHKSSVPTGNELRVFWIVALISVCSIQLPKFYELLTRTNNAPNGAVFVPDFFQDYASARNFWNGLPVYTNHTVTIPLYFNNVNSMQATNLLFMINAHPPTSIAIALPFAGFDFKTALLIFRLLSVVAVAASVPLVYCLLPKPSRSNVLISALTFIIIGEPLWDQVTKGQLSALLLLLIALVWVAARSGRSTLSGILIGLAASIKLFPVLLLLPFLLQKQLKVLWSSLLTIAGLAITTALLFGIDIYRVYFADIASQFIWFRFSWWNMSLLGFCSRLFDLPPDSAPQWQPSNPLWFSPLTCKCIYMLSCSGMIYALWYFAKIAKRPISFDNLYCSTIIIMTIISPITWDHSLLMVMPSAMWIAVHVQNSNFKAALVLCCFAILSIASGTITAWCVSDGSGPLPIHLACTIPVKLFALITLLAISLTPRFQEIKSID